MPLRAAILALLVPRPRRPPAAGRRRRAALGRQGGARRAASAGRTSSTAPRCSRARCASLAGASRMQMRFTLQARTPDTTRWSAVAAPGFGSWVSSASGTSRYVYTKRVEGLLAPAYYRVLLRFRWLDGAGRVIASHPPRTRAACRQPDPRPNLVVSSLGVRPTAKPGRAATSRSCATPGRSAAEATALRVALRRHRAAARAGRRARAGRGRRGHGRGPRVHRGGARRRGRRRRRGGRRARRGGQPLHAAVPAAVLSSQASTASQ